MSGQLPPMPEERRAAFMAQLDAELNAASMRHLERIDRAVREVTEAHRVAAEMRWRCILLAGGIAGIVGPLLGTRQDVDTAWLMRASVAMVITMAVGVVLDIFNRYRADQQRDRAAKAMLVLHSAELVQLQQRLGVPPDKIVDRATQSMKAVAADFADEHEFAKATGIALDCAFYGPLLIGLFCLGMAVRSIG